MQQLLLLRCSSLAVSLQRSPQRGAFVGQLQHRLWCQCYQQPEQQGGSSALQDRRSSRRHRDPPFSQVPLLLQLLPSRCLCLLLQPVLLLRCLRLLQQQNQQHDRPLQLPVQLLHSVRQRSHLLLQQLLPPQVSVQGPRRKQQSQRRPMHVQEQQVVLPLHPLQPVCQTLWGQLQQIPRGNMLQQLTINSTSSSSKCIGSFKPKSGPSVLQRGAPAPQHPSLGWQVTLIQQHLLQRQQQPQRCRKLAQSSCQRDS